MKLSSKSILSPSHSKDAPHLTRKLASSGSTKGGGGGSQASPNPAMFRSGGRKRGPGYVNPEPSSPKVTCIGQVRVLKQGKKMRGRSKRRGGGGGEASFRSRGEQSFHGGDLNRQKSQRSQSLQQECLSQRNQRWVHVPSAICEALRAFGSEFSCFFSCRSSCGREKHSAKAEEEGAAVGSWVVTLQEGSDPHKGREIELIMGGSEEDETQGDNNNSPERSNRRRRHVFEDIDIDIDNLKSEEEEKARVSICIPPKNALLLMRCRSDPVKMAALANRFWEPSVQATQEEREAEEAQMQMEEDSNKEVEKNYNVAIHDESGKSTLAFVSKEETEAANNEGNQVVIEEAKGDVEKEEEAIGEVTSYGEENDVAQRSELSSTTAHSALSGIDDAKGSTVKMTSEEKPVEEENRSKERESGALPECLLLMMCEPKLSMEVSRETWICTADFVRWLPPRPAAKSSGGDRQHKKRMAAVDNKPPPPPTAAVQPQQVQPGRSSFSFPAAAVASAVGTNAGEGSALKRCKSEPRRSAAKLAPEACSWNNRKLTEPHPPAPVGVGGAAGVGF
ncbi:hypothetical protein HN51_011656 [Arachis hypogaea]|uniref:Uncharacterized protein n=2 Tax=Arachis TaxID=3817 RepID=A0A445DY72_ARAHY|nr:uncharacterized protein LOC107478522 [Arachis duranensis]XP_025688170.1 uncharacterized protein LOC112790136 [Arachis hypogaea]QHO56994.1 uncharacterized protein DS421_3g78550 [Arachis hypogaea]RYR68123.1 hypothetical protein Ahy_A03g014595 isoform B [Arachis hypogaea]